MDNQRRRTKIIVTMGPALDNPKMIEKVISAGTDVFRCNFSHDLQEVHARRIRLIRKISKKLGKEVAIFADLQGPKIRVAKFKNKAALLRKNKQFILDADLDPNIGDEHHVGVDYKPLPQDVQIDDTLLIDDGRIVLTVRKIRGSKIICKIEAGGIISDHKGINKRGGGLSAKALTEKDKNDLKFAAALGVDYFAISFPRGSEDMQEARTLVQAAGSSAGLIAKIERVEAIEALDAIIEASDAVMVARGDLGVEIGDAQLPAMQKHIISRARTLNKPVITATQMMETMIHNPVPTRAEVFDVANAVLDITDAVMLSAETSVGDHPDLVVETMARICSGAEKQPSTQISTHRLERQFEKIDEAIAMATMYTANHLNISAIVSLTESGTTPLLMSRIRSGIPIFALTRNLDTQRRLNLYRGVYPMAFDITKVNPTAISKSVARELKNKGILKKGALIIITRGDILGERGHTDLMKIYRINHHHKMVKNKR
jgi:pyruvate kinase